jgi:hypothetical protein
MSALGWLGLVVALLAVLAAVGIVWALLDGRRGGKP